MDSPLIARRGLISSWLAAAAAVSASAASASAAPSAAGVTATVTAREVIERIKANVGVPWRQQTVDNLIAGDPETPVTGIATTMMATLDVLMRAARGGKNMVITHESTFFSHQDAVESLGGDETYRDKLEFIRRNGMAVFHFHDHWHARQPDGINAGMARELGWEHYAEAGNPKLYVLPETSLAALAREMARRLGARTLRVVGDPKQRVRRVQTSWGYVGLGPGISLISRADVDALAIGETREWELVEYVQDMNASGRRKKALIVIGHVASEQAGMKLCAEWLRGILPGVPVEFVAAGEPFWLAGQPTTPGGGR